MKCESCRDENATHVYTSLEYGSRVCRVLCPDCSKALPRRNQDYTKDFMPELPGMLVDGIHEAINRVNGG